MQCSPKLLTKERNFVQEVSCLWHREKVLKEGEVFQANSSWLDEIHEPLGDKIFKMFNFDCKT